MLSLPTYVNPYSTVVSTLWMILNITKYIFINITDLIHTYTYDLIYGWSYLAPGHGKMTFYPGWESLFRRHLVLWASQGACNNQGIWSAIVYTAWWNTNDIGMTAFNNKNCYSMKICSQYGKFRLKSFVFPKWEEFRCECVKYTYMYIGVALAIWNRKTKVAFVCPKFE